MKANKKYNQQRFEYAKVNEYLPKPVGREISGGTISKKPNFGRPKKSTVSHPKVNKIDHEEQ